MTLHDPDPGLPRRERTLPAASITIRCRRDGPLVVELAPDLVAGGAIVRVTDHEGGEYTIPDGERPLALCRCGASATKPFCDGSHRHNGFEASGTSPGPAAPSACPGTGPVGPACHGRP